MTWETRLKPAAYIAPDGIRLEFNYEDVSRSIEKRTSAFDFPDADGTFVQDLGRTGYKFPFKCIFWGENCDIDAQKLENLLNQRGIGKLEHPIYGTFDVVPFGEITRDDPLTSGANQAIINVTFFETTKLVYPSTQIDPESEVVISIADFCEAASEEYETINENATVVETLKNKNRFEQLLDTVSGTLADIAKVENDVYAQFTAIESSINQSIDVLVDDPLTLAFQTILMIQAPARAEQSIVARLRAYGNLAKNLLTQAEDIPDYYNHRLFSNALLTGSIYSVINHQFLTKKDALDSASEIISQFSSIIEWSETNAENLGIVDTGDVYQKLQESVALTAGYLVEMSFTLRKEYKITLERNRTIVDLVGELYGSVDDYLDFFITSNKLTGSEIIELPRGREIVYYN